jgi:uncharacterized membrane protein
MDIWNVFINLCYIFMFGSIIGYIIEVFYRRFFSAKRWINPGFLKGPYLPLYGFGLLILYSLSSISFHFNNTVLEDICKCIIMGLLATLAEYIAGVIFIKGYKVKLWDYSNMKGNIEGIICPLFTFFWLVLSFGYYYLIHPYMVHVFNFFNTYNVYFNFVIGIFYGMMLFDFIKSTQFITKIQKYTKSSKVVISYEQLKLDINKQKKEKQETFVTKYPNIKEFIDKANSRSNEMIGKLIYIEDQTSSKKNKSNNEIKD